MAFWLAGRTSVTLAGIKSLSPSGILHPLRCRYLTDIILFFFPLFVSLRACVRCLWPPSRSQFVLSTVFAWNLVCPRERERLRLVATWKEPSDVSRTCQTHSGVPRLFSLANHACHFIVILPFIFFPGSFANGDPGRRRFLSSRLFCFFYRDVAAAERKRNPELHAKQSQVLQPFMVDFILPGRCWC